jgi:threonylcarbamoyladenosine tRNA methylthiotransferase MtaB
VQTVAFITLGCKVNQYDTQAIRESLARAGYDEVPADEDAAAYIVNTCCVTAESHRKSLQFVRRIARAHPDAALVVTGCSAETHAEELRAIPGVRHVVDNAGKVDVPSLIAGVAPSAEGAWPSVSRFEGHSRAFVKIEDGCESFCSYCIVPRVRGPVRSRPPDEVVSEVERLVGNGYLEVVLTGIHLGHYGRETEGRWELVPLLERVLQVPCLRRLRLSSIELAEVTDDLLGLMADSDVLCQHLHIPLQSGDDDVLRAMNRRYTGAAFLARLEAVRARLEEPAVTTDVIVGFPGETPEQFRRTVEVSRRAGFSRMHIFPYSDREGTAAARMPGKLPRNVIRARREELSEVARDLALAYHARFVGRAVEVLTESRRDRRTGLLCGYTERYVRAFFDGPDSLYGCLVRVVGDEASQRGLAAQTG